MDIIVWFVFFDIIFLYLDEIFVEMNMHDIFWIKIANSWYFRTVGNGHYRQYGQYKSAISQFSTTHFTTCSTKNPFFKTSPGTFRKPWWLPRKLCEWPELLWVCGRCTQFCGFSEFVEDFLANFWRKNFTMARLTTKISFAGNDIWQNTMKSLYIHTYMYQSCLPSHYFYKTTKKTEQIRNSSVTSFFLTKKSTWEKFSKTMENELIVDGNQPTFFGAGEFPVGIACRPACCPSDPFMDWSSSSGIESSDSILLSVKFNDVATCRAIIRFLIKKNPHLQMNEYMGGFFHGSIFLPPKKEKLWRFCVFFWQRYVIFPS